MTVELAAERKRKRESEGQAGWARLVRRHNAARAEQQARRESARRQAALQRLVQRERAAAAEQEATARVRREVDGTGGGGWAEGLAEGGAGDGGVAALRGARAGRLERERRGRVAQAATDARMGRQRWAMLQPRVVDAFPLQHATEVKEGLKRWRDPRARDEFIHWREQELDASMG